MFLFLVSTRILSQNKMQKWLYVKSSDTGFSLFWCSVTDVAGDQPPNKAPWEYLRRLLIQIAQMLKCLTGSPPNYTPNTTTCLFVHFIPRILSLHHQIFWPQQIASRSSRVTHWVEPTHPGLGANSLFYSANTGPLYKNGCSEAGARMTDSSISF